MGWNSELHPRARNGKFISKGGFVHWKVGKKSGAGTVSSIGRDGIVVKDKKTGKAMKLRPRDITDATEPKASISIKGKKQGKAWGKMWGVDVDAKPEKLSKEEKRKALRERVHNQQLASDLAMALSAALPGKFDPLKHPRGKDGKFIEVGGWVKWTLGSHEYRGQVKKIDGDGKVTIAMGTGKNGVPITRHVATKNLSQAAPNKATLGQPAWMPSAWAGHDEDLRKVESNGPAMAELGLLKDESQPAVTQDAVDHYAKQIDAEKAARDAHRAELKKQGLSDRDVESVMKNGYIMPDPTDTAEPEPTPSILDLKDHGSWGERLVQAGYSLHLLDAMGVDTYGLADGRTVKAEDYYLPAGLSPADRKKVEQVRATYNSATKGDKLIVPGHDGPLTVSHVMPKAVYATDAKGDTYELKPGEFTKDGELPTEKKLAPPVGTMSGTDVYAADGKVTFGGKDAGHYEKNNDGTYKTFGPDGAPNVDYEGGRVADEPSAVRYLAHKAEVSRRLEAGQSMDGITYTPDQSHPLVAESINAMPDAKAGDVIALTDRKGLTDNYEVYAVNGNVVQFSNVRTGDAYHYDRTTGDVYDTNAGTHAQYRTMFPATAPKPPSNQQTAAPPSPAPKPSVTLPPAKAGVPPTTQKVAAVAKKLGIEKKKAKTQKQANHGKTYVNGSKGSLGYKVQKAYGLDSDGVMVTIDGGYNDEKRDAALADFKKVFADAGYVVEPWMSSKTIFTITAPEEDAAPSTPEAPSAPSAPAPSAPNPDKITPDTYGGKLTKDGKVPKVGQMVTTGKAGLKGKVLKVIEKRGWIQVELPDGTKKVTTLNTTTVDAEPGEAPDVPKAPDVSKAAKPPSAPAKPSPAPKVALSIPDQSYAAQAVDDYAWAVTKDGDEGTYSNFLDVRDKLKSGDGSNLTPDDLNMMRTALYNQPQSPKRDALIAKIDAMLGTKPAAPAPAKPAALSPDVVTDLAVGDGKKLTDLVVKAVSDAGLGVKNPGYYDGSRGWTTAQGSTGFSVRDLGDGKLHLNIVLSPKAMGIPKQPEVLYEDGQEVTYYKPNEEVAKAKATDVANLVRSIGLNPISAVNDGYSLVDDHIEYGVVIDDPRKPKPKPKPKSTVGVSKPKATGSIKVPAGKKQRDKIITALEDAADKVSPDERTVYDDIAKRIDAGLGLSVSDAGRVLDALNDMADNPANGPADYNLIGFYQKALAGKKPMTSAGFARFNPSKHPRGADGRFIEVGGFVSWLVRGNRKTGKVLKVDNQAKTAVVQMDDGTPVTLPAEKLYKADRKAKIDYRSFAFDRTRKFGPDTPDEELQKIAFDKDAIWNGTDLDSTDVQDARYELERRANEQMFERATKRRQGITAGSGASGTFSSNGQRFSTPMPTPPAAQPRRARRRRQPVSDRLGGPAPTRSQLGPPPKQEWTKQPAATPGWQATEHPRGADGRFVEVGGFVEWKDPAGKPGRGQVTKMNGDGTVVIKQDNGTEATVPASQVRQQPKVKARLNPAFVQRQVRHQIRQNQ